MQYSTVSVTNSKLKQVSCSEKTGYGYVYVGFRGSVGMGILWGYPQDFFLWVWDGYGDRNSVPTAALPIEPRLQIN